MISHLSSFYCNVLCTISKIANQIPFKVQLIQHLVSCRWVQFFLQNITFVVQCPRRPFTWEEVAQFWFCHEMIKSVILWCNTLFEDLLERMEENKMQSQVSFFRYIGPGDRQTSNYKILSCSTRHISWGEN